MTSIEDSMQGESRKMSRPGEEFQPGPVLLLGAPGVGKGTQAQLLEAAFRIPQISTGDLLRQNRREHTPLGMVADELMRTGHLVPDHLVNEMVAVRLEADDTGRGYILDGFPRTLAQATWLDQRAIEKRATPLIALEIFVEESKLLRRITGRRICPNCNRIYNVYLNPPKIDGMCDEDGAKLVQRADDTEEAFHKRMQVYAAQTMPVIPHYKTEGRFRQIDGDQAVDVVSQAVADALYALRQAGSV